MPHVTVALPVRNGEPYLSGAIDSILVQEGVDFELAIYDNCSTDGTLAVAQRYAAADPRVRVVSNEFDIHCYGSLNRALLEADCEFFVPFAGHDDLMLPGNLAKKVAALEETGAGFVHSYAVLIDGDGAATGLTMPLDHVPPYMPAPDFFPLTGPANPVILQSVVARREALLAIGGFDMRVPYCSDWLAWQLLALRFGVATIHEPLVAYRQHAASATTSILARGDHARDIPAAARAPFEDAAMPAELRATRAIHLGARIRMTARDLQNARLMRAADNYAAYVLAGEALLLQPQDAETISTYLGLVAAAGLAQPRLPFDAVAAPDPSDVAGLAEHCRQLAGLGLLARVAIAVEPARLDEVVPALQQEFAAGPDVEIDVVPAALEDLLAPGQAVLCPFGSPLAARAEAAGIPVNQYALPDPMAKPADPARYETIPVAQTQEP